jgi:putrescine aminotransferase
MIEILGEALEATHSARDSQLFESYQKFINPTYPLFLKKLGLDRVAVKAEGVLINDAEGKTYIDCVGGYGLFNLGHNHPEILRALTDQLSEKQLFTKPFITEISVRLAEHLSKITPGDLDCSFLCNSGSEAIDSAIKLARLHQGKGQIIAAENSFHGYTYGALSASGIPSFKRFFEPMVPEIVHVPYGDIDALKQTISATTAAILLEPIQHEAGISLPRKSYLRAVRQLCDDKDVILILDEIKTGFGKTGYMFACEYFGIVPDILVVGKSLGGGLVPVGGLIAKKSLWKKFGLSFPMSASSFAGNTLACRAALATIQIIHKEKLLNNCRQKGAFFLQKLDENVKRYPSILKAVNGLGLLIGIETVSPQTALSLAKEMIRQRVLMVPAFGNPSVLMIEPPLVISFEQIEEVLRCFETACERSDRTN